MAEDTKQMAMDAEESAAIEDMNKEGLTDEPAGQIESFVRNKFTAAETARRYDEERWIKAYRNYRGLYGPDVQFTEAEKSRVFIKITKTKTLAAYGQIVDVLFAGNKFPISIEPTELPEGVLKDVSFDPKEPEEIRDRLDEFSSPYGFMGDGTDFPKGATAKSLQDVLVLSNKIWRALKTLKQKQEKHRQR